MFSFEKNSRSFSEDPYLTKVVKAVNEPYRMLLADCVPSAWEDTQGIPKTALHLPMLYQTVPKQDQFGFYKEAAP
jgi:hypothetical protein